MGTPWARYGHIFKLYRLQSFTIMYISVLNRYPHPTPPSCGRKGGVPVVVHLFCHYIRVIYRFIPATHSSLLAQGGGPVAAPTAADAVMAHATAASISTHSTNTVVARCMAGLMTPPLQGGAQ